MAGTCKAGFRVVEGLAHCVETPTARARPNRIRPCLAGVVAFCFALASATASARGPGVDQQDPLGREELKILLVDCINASDTFQAHFQQCDAQRARLITHTATATALPPFKWVVGAGVLGFVLGAVVTALVNN